MKYHVLFTAAALYSRPLHGQVIVWDDAPTSVIPQRRTKDTQVSLNVPELNGTMQQLFADVSGLKTGMATASSKVAALNAKVQPPAQVPSGLVAPPAPSPTPTVVIFHADRRRGDGLPEQGFEGEDVEHEDGETKTDDWGEEYGPDSGDEDSAEEHHVAMHSKKQRARHHRGHRRHRPHRKQVGDEEGLPEQGFEGEDVEHEDGETKTDDWGEEYGPDSDGADGADEEDTTEGRVAMHSKARSARHHGQREGARRRRSKKHGRRPSRTHLRVRREEGEERDNIEEAPSFVQSKEFEGRDAEHKAVFLQRSAAKAAPKAPEYYAPWFGAPGNVPETVDRSVRTSGGGGFPLPGAATAVEPQQPEQGFEGEDVEHKDGETYTGDWQEEHGQSTEQTTEAPSTTAAAP